MQDGSFYCFVPRSGWQLLQRTKSERLVEKKLDTVASSFSEDECLISHGSQEHSSDTVVPHVQSYVFRHGGITVRLGVCEVTLDICRVTPYVYVNPESSSVICFTGFLSNLSELGTRYGPGHPHRRSSDGGRGSPLASMLDSAAAQPLERKSSIERSLDIGALTASVVLQMYESMRSGKELIMLSELQGQYAFVIWDNTRKHAVAARDPSGLEHLFFHISDDGAISFANKRMDIPGAERASDWQELPPGHYISGKAPRLYQFALTPEQLQSREVEESLSLESDEAEATGAVSPMASSVPTRSSLDRTSRPLDYNSSRPLTKHRSIDLGVFALDL